MGLQTTTGGSQALVAHASNPSYSGSREQEDRGSKQIVPRDCISKKLITKKGWLKV
jgi:hypothetical protein